MGQKLQSSTQAKTFKIKSPRDFFFLSKQQNFIWKIPFLIHNEIPSNDFIYFICWLFNDVYAFLKYITFSSGIHV